MIKYEDLKKDFLEDEIEWRIQRCGFSQFEKPYAIVLAYVAARAIQDRLDSVFGVDGWKDEYRVLGNNIICRLSVKNDNGEWIAKENGAPETDIESFKGGISNAFKRVAASGYGIGRYLYKLDTKFAECSIENRNGWNQAKDSKTSKYIYWKTPKLNDKKDITKTPTPNPITEITKGALLAKLESQAKKVNIDIESLLGDLCSKAKFPITSIDQIKTNKQIEWVNSQLERRIKEAI
ncbi:MAG: Rad52/Rad22 family DNA repair protein [Gammaproteobacteria bacterium]|nr:Rad52/Rad22 family DNA repair protein [Gammaproteobacteria bacterium]